MDATANRQDYRDQIMLTSQIIFDIGIAHQQLDWDMVIKLSEKLLGEADHARELLRRLTSPLT